METNAQIDYEHDYQLIDFDAVKKQKLVVQPITGWTDKNSKMSIDVVFVNQLIGSPKTGHYSLFIKPNFSWRGQNSDWYDRISKESNKITMDLQDVTVRIFGRNEDVHKIKDVSGVNYVDFKNLKWTLNTESAYEDYKGFQKFEIPAKDIEQESYNVIQYQISYRGSSSDYFINTVREKVSEQGIITIDTHLRRETIRDEDNNTTTFIDDNLAFAYLQYNAIEDEKGYYNSIFKREYVFDFNSPDNPLIDPIDKLFRVRTNIYTHEQFEKMDLSYFGLTEDFFDVVSDGVLVNELPEVNLQLRSLTGENLKKAYGVELQANVEKDNYDVFEKEKPDHSFNVSIANHTLFDPYLNTVREAFTNQGSTGLVRNPNFIDKTLLDINIKIGSQIFNFELPIFNELISNYNMFFLNKYDNIINGDSIEQFKICFLFTPDIISRFVNINDFNYKDFLELEKLAESNV